MVDVIFAHAVHVVSVVCRCQVNIDDYDDIGGDELIGRTVIDLEDRWFDQRWQVMACRHVTRGSMVWRNGKE